MKQTMPIAITALCFFGYLINPAQAQSVTTAPVRMAIAGIQVLG